MGDLNRFFHNFFCKHGFLPLSRWLNDTLLQCSYFTSEYVASLEKEIREIKAKNRELAQSLSKARSKPSEEIHVVDGTKDDSHIREIVKQLNSTIGELLLIL